MRRPLSLAQQNALRLIVVFVAFEIIAALAVVWLLMVPLARRAADDFGELLALSAETWSELPPMTRPAFERHLRESHGIELQLAPPADAREREGRDFYALRVRTSPDGRVRRCRRDRRVGAVRRAVALGGDTERRTHVVAGLPPQPRGNTTARDRAADAGCRD